MDFLYYVFVFAGCIALASLITALISWRGRESKLAYTLVFIALCYAFIFAAFQYLFVDEKMLNPWQQWQDLYHQMKEDKKPAPTQAPKECKDEKAKGEGATQKA